MSKALDGIRGLVDTISDIRTAVRASREYRRLCIASAGRRADQGAASQLLPR